MKPWYKSWTVVSAVVYAAIQAAEQQGIVPTGAFQAIADLIQTATVATGVFGLRRAMEPAKPTV